MEGRIVGGGVERGGDMERKQAYDFKTIRSELSKLGKDEKSYVLHWRNSYSTF